MDAIVKLDRLKFIIFLIVAKLDDTRNFGNLLTI